MDRLEFLNKELNVDLISLDEINWINVSRNIQLSEEFIREFQDKFDWKSISINQKLSEDFIREFQNRVNWDYISEYQKLSEDFIREFQNKVDWYVISRCQKLSEDFIREFKDKIDWSNVSIYQKLSEDFIREFKDKVDWCNLLIYQKLSENFIKEFKDKIFSNLGSISKYQKLSENFIREFKYKVSWPLIISYQKLSPEFIEEFDLDIDEDNWLYKSTDFKKQQIVDCGLYECHEDYFIAYKATRNHRYSLCNFQYQYLPNETYECHCDCTDNEDSFGLSVWTYEGAKNYDSTGLIVKVRVRYEDVGRLVHGENKIRCFKIEILE